MDDTQAANYTEDQLRFALAMNRGIAMLSPKTERGKKLSAEFSKLFTPIANNIATPDEVLYHIHQGLFEDWRQPADPTVADSVKRGKLADVLEDFLWNDDTGLIDANNFPVSLEKETLSKTLARFHKGMQEIEPFAYGNRLTTEFFLTALFDQPMIQELYEPIDFNHISDENRRILTNKQSSEEELASVFAAIVKQRPYIQNERNGFTPWKKSAVRIKGVRFLAYKDEDQTYVVTVNGGLVLKEKVEAAMEAHRAANGLIADLPPLKAEIFLQDVLPKTDKNTELLEKLQSFRNKEIIDGIPVKDPQAAPLCCLDIDILTGLRPTSNDRLKQLFTEVEKTAKFPLALANNETLRKNLLNKAGGDERLRRSIEIAYERISYLKPQMEKARDAEFEDKTPSEKPHFVMSMGGGGSGKTAAKDIAAAVSDGNYVEASLDAFRSHSDLYPLLLAVDHHADDYTLVQGIAGTMRDWVAEKARNGKYSLLYDGTGIDYEGRYDKLTKAYKEVGYTNRLCAVDSSIEMAIDNVQGRYDREGRALLWPVVTGKHTNFPDSFMAAAKDPNFDRVMLFANDKEYKQHHLVAETCYASPSVLPLIKSRGRLMEELKKLQAQENSVLPILNGKDEGYKHRIPEMSEENSAFLRVRENKVLAIYQADRFTQMLEKGKMNIAASSPDNLRTPPRALRFAVEPNPPRQTGLG